MLNYEVCKKLARTLTKEMKHAALKADNEAVCRGIKNTFEYCYAAIIKEFYKSKID